MNLRAILRKLKPEDIKLAIRYGALERRRERLQGQLTAVLNELTKLEGNGAVRPRRGPGRPRKVEAPAPVKRRKISRAGRLRMKAAAVLRWQRAKAKTEPAATVSQ